MKFNTIFVLLIIITGCTMEAKEKKNLETATLGAGCFWCVEAIFEELEGVSKVVSGYSGGSLQNPTYQEVCSGKTGHAEVVQIQFDPQQISFAELLEVFWGVHDPTTLNKQGDDIGTQYRSVIFCHDATQKQVAESLKKGLNEAAAFENPIVTEIADFEQFFSAESNHQNYYKENPNQAYCKMVVRPKYEKFKQVFRSKLKK